MSNAGSDAPARVSLRAARKAAGWSLARAAVNADVSEPTARVFEADPRAVSPESRAKLEAVYSRFEGRDAL
jgi:transcriptional regulator with XRE-family HTH domain